MELVLATKYKLQKALPRGLRLHQYSVRKSRFRGKDGTQEIVVGSPRSDTLLILQDLGPPLVGSTINQIR